MAKLFLASLALPILVFALVLTIGAGAADLPLRASSRDDLFTPDPPFLTCNEPLENPACAGLCTEMKLDYNIAKNVNGRDADPERGIAKPKYYDLHGLQQRKISIAKEPPYGVSEVQSQRPGAMYTWAAAQEDLESADESDQSVTSYEVGNPADKNCKWATIWIHGATPVRGGLGVIDNSFGGAFNRMKHLAQDNHGLYYSPSIQNFMDDSGVVALIKHIRTSSCPKGKIIINCASAGTITCWRLAADKRIVNEISGLVLIGSSGGPGADFLKSEAAKARIPVVFTQGERDHSGYWQRVVQKIHNEDPTYPIRYIVFKNGGHMTPLRMLDWRSTMNCMLTQAPEARADEVLGPR